MTHSSAEPAVASIVEVLRRHAAVRPDRPHLTWLADGERPEAALTFGQLAARVDAVALALVGLGVQPGQRALLLYPQGPDFVVAFLACLSSGVIAVPAYPPRNARHMARIESILSDAGAVLVLCVEESRARIESWLSGRSAGQARVIATDTFTSPAAPGWTPPAPHPDRIAFLQYTSGSTGQPKGVIVTHENMLANLRMINETFAHDEDSHLVSWLPAYHDMGLIGNLITPIYSGSQVILMSPAAFLQKPSRWLEAISRFKARISGAPNFAFDLAARTITAEQKAGLDLSSLELLYNGSEPIDARVLSTFTETFASCGLRASALYPCYGMAEATLLATGSRKGGGAGTLEVDAEALAARRGVPATADTESRRMLVSCGWSVRGQELAIVDPETRRSLPNGEIGEIWLSGPHIAKGYWRQDELTEATFGARLQDGRGPFLRTGDLGFQRNGELYVTGRIKDLIIIRGRNHYPHDIESTVRDAHAALRGDGMAFSMAFDGEERLVVVQEIDRHRHAEAEAAVNPIRAAIVEEHEISPHVVVIVRQSSLPKTSSGKKQRLACARAYQEGSLQVVFEWKESAGVSVEPVEPGQLRSRDEIEAFLVQRLASSLAVSPDAVDVSAPFNSFGLDSLRVMTLHGELEAWMGQSLLPTVFWNYPTIETLAVHLADESASADLDRAQG